MRYFNLIRGVFVRVIAEFKRYWMNTLSTFVVFTIIFSMIVLGLRAVGGPKLGGTVRDVAVGYFTWTILLFSLTSLSWNIMNEMNRGFIEQVFISPFGPLAVYATYALVDALVSIPLLYLLMLVIFLIAGLSLTVPPSFILVMVTLLVQGVGMGLSLAGLTLKFKRTNALLQLVQFAVLGILIVHVPRHLWFIVPIYPHFELMREITAGEGFDLLGYGLTLVSTVVYATFGIVVFRVFERLVRKSGDLSMY